MKRKTIVCMFFASFFAGCYNTGIVTKDELNTKNEQVDITVYTQDSTVYKFLKDNYSIQGDTLTGFGVQTSGGHDQSFHGAIPFADITSLKTEEFDLTTTIVAIALPVGLVSGLFIAMAVELSKH